MSRTAQRWWERMESLATVLLLLLAVLLIGWLGNRHNLAWDWSDSARNSLAPASRELLSRIDSPLEITCFAPENRELREAIREIIARYQRLQPAVSLDFIDPSLHPELTRAANIQLSGELRLSYRGRSENLQTLDEQHISNAIQRLLLGGERLILGIDGHGERRLQGRANHDLGDFAAKLGERGYRTQALNLPELPQIPGNASLLLLAGAQVEYLTGEAELVLRHLEAGNNLLWLLDPGPLNGLDGVAQQLGLRLLPGTIVDASAADLGLESPTIALVGSYPAHPATRGFRYLTLYPEAAALEVTENGEWTATPILATRERSWNETGQVKGAVSPDPEQGERMGPLAIGYALSRERAGWEQRVVVIGDGDFLSNAFLGNAGNLDLGLNLVRWLAGDEKLIDIPAHTAGDLTLELTPGKAAVIGIGSLFVLPGLLFATGLVIAWRRRRG